VPASTEPLVQLSCEHLIELRAGCYLARVAPAAGGRVASLSWLGAAAPRALLVEWDLAAFDQHAWPKAGAFPMLPFANRLPPNGFRARGTPVCPEPGPEGFPVHGSAHRRKWEAVAVSGTQAVLRYAHKPGDAGWPWTWSAEQEMDLSDAGLTVVIRVRNESEGSMPLGIGWHPYHPLPPETSAISKRIQAEARRELDEDGRAAETGAEPVFGMRPGETAAFVGWDGGFRLPAVDGTIVVTCEGASSLVLHRPAAGDYLCAEPVTLLPGHLCEDTDESGPGWLQPGDTQRFSWTCGFEAIA
jgi:aldose 1-epimerase